MATTTALTPATPQSAPPAAPTPPTGTWTHPRMREIERRREASTFTTTNAMQTTLFTLILLSTFWTPGSWLRAAMYDSSIPPHHMHIADGADHRSITPFPASLESLLLNAIRLLLVFATSNSLRPFWAPADAMEDIPLTPTQRKLLGLPPTPSSALPSATGGAYITPPRYARSTPRSDSSRAAVAGSSPVGMGTPYSGSPLARKAMEGRRSSYGSPIGGGGSLFEEGGSSSRGSPVFGESATLSPGGRGASVGLNSKWLYQRGKSRPSFGL